MNGKDGGLTKQFTPIFSISHNLLFVHILVVVMAEPKRRSCFCTDCIVII